MRTHTGERADLYADPMVRDAAGAGQPLLVLGKITQILDVFSLERPALTLSEIRGATGLPTSTVQRLVTNLVSAGFLDRQSDSYRIGVRLAYWAAPAVKGVDVIDLLLPLLRDLRDTTGETACFFRAEQGYRVCVALAETEHPLRREMHVGKILPLHAGSASRVLLAWDDGLAGEVLARPLDQITSATITSAGDLRAVLDQTKSDGYAITVAEREMGASGLSAPVFNSAAELVGAITISGPTMRMPLDQCEEWVELLLGTADHATRLLGGRVPALVLSR
jgi:DNA-binding IclR family transcriptional regulator